MSHLGIKFGASNFTDNNDLKCYLDIKQAGADLLSVFSTETRDSQGYLKTTLNHDPTKQLSLTLFNIDNVTNTDFSLLIICFSVENPDGARWQLNYNIPAGKSATQTFTIPNSSNYYGTLVSIYNNKTSSTSAGISYVPSGSVLNGVATKVLSKKVSDTSFTGTETPNIPANPNYQTGAPVGGVTVAPPVTSKLTESSIRVSWTNTIGAARWRFKYSNVGLGLIFYSPDLTSGTYFDFTEYLLPSPIGSDTVLAGTYAFRTEVQIGDDTTWYSSDLGNGVYISGVLNSFPNDPPFATKLTENSISFDCRGSSYDQILRTFSLFKDDVLYKKTRKDGLGVWKDVDIVTNVITTTTSTWFTTDGNQFIPNNLAVGSYKCKFKFDSYYEGSYSSVVTLEGKSTTPTVAIDGSNSLQVNVSGLVSGVSKTVKIYRNGVEHASTTVASGLTTANFVVSLYGNYTAAVIEDGKAISDISNSVTVLTKSTTPHSVYFTKVLESYKNTITSIVTINGQVSDECTEVRVYRKSDNVLVATINTFTAVLGNYRKFSYTGNNNMNVGDSFYIKQIEVMGGVTLLESNASPDYIVLEFNPSCTITDLAITKGTTGENDFVITFATPNPITASYKITNNPVFGLGDVYQEGQLTLSTNPSVTNGKKAFINLTNVEEGSYYCHVYSTTTGSSCNASSTMFNFDIVVPEIVEVELGASEGQDCLSLALGAVTEVKNNDGSVTFTAIVNSSTPLDAGTLFYAKVGKDSEVYGQTATTGVALSGSNISVIVPANKVQPRNTSIDFVVTVNTSSSAQYGCSASKTVLTVSESSLTESAIPVIRDLQENNGRIFIECCINAKLIVYVNNSIVYATLNNTTSNLVEVVSDTYELKIGDVLNATQTCPNQTVSKLSASRTVTSTCNAIANGSIEGSTKLPIGAITTYTVTGLTGEPPFTYLAEVSGGTIQSGQGTNSVSVKWKSSVGNGIIGFTISNCNGKSQKVLTKNVQLSTDVLPTGGIRPRITSVINNVIKGLGEVGMIITLYDSNNKVIKTGIVVDASGTWNSGKVASANAYYTVGILNGVKTEVSNIAINLDACRNHKGSVLC